MEDPRPVSSRASIMREIPCRRTVGIKILPPGKSGSIYYFFKNSVGVIAGTEEPAKSLIFLVRI